METTTTMPNLDEMGVSYPSKFSAAKSTISTTRTESEDDYSLTGFEHGEDDNHNATISFLKHISASFLTSWSSSRMEDGHSNKKGEKAPLLSSHGSDAGIVDQTYLAPIRTEAKVYPASNPFFYAQGRPQHRRGRSEMITSEYRRRRYERRKQIFACCLATLSGFCDVVCHNRFGHYGNMMTGNTLRLLDHVTAGRWGEAAYPAALVPAYIVGASLCAYLNKLDLSHLGLSGPSSQAFSHLNPPRRLRPPEQIAVLRVVAIGCAILFLMGDAFVWINRSHVADRWRLPFYSCGFGLLNAATLAAIHLVTNAVTGHWITVGLGVADDLPVLLNRQSSRVGPESTTNNPTEQIPEPVLPPPSSGKSKAWISSIMVAASFLGSAFVTSLLYNECLRRVEEEMPDDPMAWMFTHSPPLGVLFTILYTFLLYWYTLPPPYLQGFSSRSDLGELME